MMKLKSVLGFAMAAVAVLGVVALFLMINVKTEGHECKNTEENCQTNAVEQVQKRDASEPRPVKTSTPAGWTDDFEVAKRRAVAEDKLILVDFSGSDWCGWCKKLDAEVFSKKEFLSAATNKFVLLMIDSPRDKTLLSKKATKQNPDLVRKYGIDGFPAVLVLDWDGAVLYKTGYRAGGPAAYLKELENQPFSRGETHKREGASRKVSQRNAESERRVAEREQLRSENERLRAELSRCERAEQERQARAEAGLIRTTRAPDGYVLVLENATVAHALDIYCKDFGKAPLIDPECSNLERVRITLKSPEGKTLTRAESLAAIRTALEMNGLYLEDYGDDFIFVLPRKNACKRGIPIIMDLGAARLGNGMNLVSGMISFENISAEDAQKVLEGSKSSEGQLVVFAHTNRILVTDAERNVKRMLELAKAIDVASPATEQAFVRQIKNASATDIKAVLDQLVRDSQKSQTAQNGRLSPMPAPLARGRNPRSPQSTADNASILFDISDADRGIIRGRVTIAAEEHANKLVIVASKANMDFFDKVIETLDVKPLVSKTEAESLDSNKEQGK